MSHRKIFFILIFVVGVISQASLYNLGGFWKGPGTPVAEWTWMTGTKYKSDELAVYGTLGVSAPTNTPGARIYHSTWVDSTDRLWFFGGSAHDINGDFGMMNDLWNYNPSTNEWTWVSGSQTTFIAPTHGTINVSAPSNNPGGRIGALTWVDQSNDILWLFGGESYSDGYMSDLWKFTISTGEWTWVHGPSTGNNGAALGTIEVPSTANNPSARAYGATWFDDDGTMWLFGGQIYGSMYNDVWSYSASTDEWTWFKGDSDSFYDFNDGPPPVYGTQGVSAAGNTPSGRIGAMSWVNKPAGVLWFFGGYGLDENGDHGLMNDIWKFELSNKRWTWVAGDKVRNQVSVPGTQNVPSIANKIGAKTHSALWQDASGLVWIFGGRTIGIGCDWHTNDLWTFNPTNNQVAWRAGGTDCSNTNNPGAKGLASTSNYPSVRFEGLGYWQNNASNLFYFYGGNGFDTNSSAGSMGDLWIFNPLSGAWGWMTGSVENPFKIGVYGTKGVEAANVEPGARSDAEMVSTDDGSLWLFGGLIYTIYEGNFSPAYNSLMKYNPTTNRWTWVSGDAGIPGTPVYGTKGTPSSLNTPPPLEGHSMVKDSNGMIWVFGGNSPGYIFAAAGSNNLWRYNPTTNQWTWMTGTADTYDQLGIYGTQNVPSPTNTPGSRSRAAMAADSLGNLWLFGGYGLGASGVDGLLNDLWRYDTNTNQWTWISGSQSAGTTNGVYGTKGVANPSNFPGSRDSSHLWVDTNNHLFLHGGYGFESVNGFEDRLADTWRFDGSNWTWVHGPDNTFALNVATVWGTPGVFASSNLPGARELATSFQERGGYFWLTGGFSQDSQGFGGFATAQDLWKYDPVSNQWACAFACADSFFNNSFSTSGLGITSPTNMPGQRLNTGATIDRFGTIWMYGSRFGGDAMFWKYK